MNKIKDLKKWIPETYLIASVIYYWIMTGTLLNPFAIVLLTFLIMLIVLKNRTFGMVLSILFLVLNLYMVLALISELNEFPAFNKDAQILLLVGSIYLGVNILLSVFMLLKWERLAVSSAN
jgi:hypothetical protein